LLEGKKKWMVQVSLAANQANADATVSKLRAKGYKVVTSPTSKGIRVMVGPAKDRETADTARRKIQADSSLGMKSAWIIDWITRSALILLGWMRQLLTHPVNIFSFK
jgi:hypothetical protein